MKILDTDILIGLLRKNKDAINKLVELKEEDIGITVFSWQELLFGPSVMERREEFKVALELLNSFKPLNYETGDSFYTVKLLTHLKRRGSPIGVIDTMIGGMCLRYNATIVTRNVKDFSRIPMLKVESW